VGPRREHRGAAPRTDAELLADDHVMGLLEAVAAGRVIRPSSSATARFLVDGMPVELRVLARQDLLYAPMGGAVPPTLAPRGQRLLAAWRGELPAPLE
jgi:hypothetical protein